eukprot:403349802
MKIYKQQIFAICAVLYALALANGNEEFLSDEQRELFSTTITSDPRSCKLTCIDQGQQFCASPQYAQGYCCDKNYNCNQGAECSTQLPAATINSNLKYFPCPYASKCGGSKLITVTNSTSTLQYNRAAGSMTTGDVCGFRLTASNTSAANTIIITFKTLSGAQAFLYSGGSTYETATKQQLVDLNSNGGRYEFTGQNYVYLILMGFENQIPVQYSLNYELIITPPVVTPPPSDNNQTQATDQKKKQENGESSLPIIIGIAIGAVVLIIALVILVVILVRRKMRQNRVIEISKDQTGQNSNQNNINTKQSLWSLICCCCKQSNSNDQQKLININKSQSQIEEETTTRPILRNNHLDDENIFKRVQYDHLESSQTNSQYTTSGAVGTSSSRMMFQSQQSQRTTDTSNTNAAEKNLGFTAAALNMQTSNSQGSTAGLNNQQFEKQTVPRSTNNVTNALNASQNNISAYQYTQNAFNGSMIGRENLIDTIQEDVEAQDDYEESDHDLKKHAKNSKNLYDEAVLQFNHSSSIADEEYKNSARRKSNEDVIQDSSDDEDGTVEVQVVPQDLSNVYEQNDSEDDQAEVSFRPSHKSKDNSLTKVDKSLSKQSNWMSSNKKSFMLFEGDDKINQTIRNDEPLESGKHTARNNNQDDSHEVNHMPYGASTIVTPRDNVVKSRNEQQAKLPVFTQDESHLHQKGLVGANINDLTASYKKSQNQTQQNVTQQDHDSTPTHLLQKKHKPPAQSVLQTIKQNDTLSQFVNDQQVATSQNDQDDDEEFLKRKVQDAQPFSDFGFDMDEDDDENNPDDNEDFMVVRKVKLEQNKDTSGFADDYSGSGPNDSDIFTPNYSLNQSRQLQQQRKIKPKKTIKSKPKEIPKAEKWVKQRTGSIMSFL